MLDTVTYEAHRVKVSGDNKVSYFKTFSKLV